MTINIKSILELVQQRVANVDSNTSVFELENLYKLARTVDGVVGVSYDSDGLLPDATSTDYRLAYIQSSGTLKLNNGSWDNISGGGGSSPSPSPAPTPTRDYGGTTAGFAMGGWNNAGFDVFNQFSFTSDGNATTVASIGAYNGPIGASSVTNGYKAGGSASPYSTRIDKFPFALPSSVQTGIGTTTAVRSHVGGNMNSGEGGYLPGGFGDPSNSSTIDKYPFASDTNASVCGNLDVGIAIGVANSSPTSGYISGGQKNVNQGVPIYTNDVRKFPYASDGNTTNVATLNDKWRWSAGVGNDTSGYQIGGDNGSGNTRYIRKFSYAAETSQSQTGAVLSTLGFYGGGGCSSTTFGYAVGGYGSPPGDPINVIQKFPFASDGNTTDVGDITNTVYLIGTAQV